MTETLRRLNGAGLAAPQIGINKRVIVVEVRKTDLFPDRPTSALLQMINPLIKILSDTTELGWEGCFSIPGIMGKVPRATEIEVTYATPEGATHQEKFCGYVARVIQHEVDHLDGVLYLDKVPSRDDLSTILDFRKHNGNPPCAQHLIPLPLQINILHKKSALEYYSAHKDVLIRATKDCAWPALTSKTSAPSLSAKPLSLAEISQHLSQGDLVMASLNGAESLKSTMHFDSFALIVGMDAEHLYLHNVSAEDPCAYMPLPHAIFEKARAGTDQDLVILRA
jgi:peptide deformylase